MPVNIVFVSLFLNFKLSSTYCRFMLLLLQKRKKPKKGDATRPTEIVVGVGVKEPVPSSPNLYEVFGLKRSQVKYSQLLHPRNDKDKVPLKIRTGHMDVAATKQSVAASSRLKGKRNCYKYAHYGSLLLMLFM